MQAANANPQSRLMCEPKICLFLPPHTAPPYYVVPPSSRLLALASHGVIRCPRLSTMMSPLIHRRRRIRSCKTHVAIAACLSVFHAPFFTGVITAFSTGGHLASHSAFLRRRGYGRDASSAQIKGRICSGSRTGHNNGPSLFAIESSEDSDSDISVLLPAATTPLPVSPEGGATDDAETSSNDPSTPATATATATLFINQQTKRILIEELQYKRAEVERLRPELAGPIVSKKVFRPEGGVPEEWLIAETETSSAMIEKLERESKYPLKFPLLAVCLILVGKGSSDALITLIKVQIDFPGASLSEEFMGIPVLAIDAVCIALGSLIASWTWQNMRDD